jgi:hypothetical protein
MRGLETHEQMHVIGHPADAQRGTVQPVHDAAEIIVQTIAPRASDDRLPVSRGKDKVVEQTGVGRGHGCNLL